MYANSIHLIDYIRFFGRGRISEVTPVTAWRGTETDIMAAFVAFDSGDTAVYECHLSRPGPWAVAVSTATERWEMRPLERARYQVTGERTQHELPVGEADTSFKPGFRLQAEQAVRAARGEESQAVALHEALETMRLIRGIYGV
jgi:hypothetical protein